VPGQRGEAVRDLQRQLVHAGALGSAVERGVYCAATEAAVSQFQAGRGLHVTGVCDQDTWSALVEAGWTLGDRVLVLAAPQLRGDDVVELQLALNRLGFDCGRPDGIFGPSTVRALTDFQRNSGLVHDGMCGPTTVAVLGSLGRQTGAGPGIASIREGQVGTVGPESIVAARIVVGQFGGLSAVARAVSRRLRHLGATVMSTDEYDQRAQAAAANRFGAAAYLGLEARAETCSTICYFAVPSFESVGGRRLATGIAESLGSVALDPTTSRPSRPAVEGMRLPVLRETRMPAVLCVLGPARQVVDASPLISEALVEALSGWITAPHQDPPPPDRHLSTADPQL
jgi:N-acetylmuramoyl-L-alanine amidase